MENKKVIQRNQEISIYEELYLSKERNKKNKHNIQSLVKEVFHTKIYLTKQKYTGKENSEKRKTVKNGLNIINDVPYLNEEMTLETVGIMEWIYKKMYIENVREVNYETMKERYYKEEQKTYKI